MVGGDIHGTDVQSREYLDIETLVQTDSPSLVHTKPELRSAALHIVVHSNIRARKMAQPNMCTESSDCCQTLIAACLKRIAKLYPRKRR